MRCLYNKKWETQEEAYDVEGKGNEKWSVWRIKCSEDTLNDEW